LVAFVGGGGFWGGGGGGGEGCCGPSRTALNVHSFLALKRNGGDTAASLTEN